jgi:hypothetical protein
MRLRIPFRYGIVTVTALPHVIVRAEVEIDGDRHVGLAAENLALKWFTKDPNVSAREEFAQMRQVIETACDVARAAGKHASVFEWWVHTYQGQAAWAGGWGIPPLLAHLGTSLMERAVIDAFCKAHDFNFATAARENRFGIRLGDVHPELGQAQPRDFLPAAPLRSIVARHTVGLADALTESEINDDLPESLAACVRDYGLTHFKIKLAGDVGTDVERLRQIAEVLRPPYAFTLDANENFPDIASFRSLWSAISREPSLTEFMSRLLFVEQPLHRDAALSPATTRELRAWDDRPPIVIDESDADLTAARRALEAGYAGTSHKNCKGVIKSIISASLLRHRGGCVLSAEDLTTVGPVALLQDLAVVATLGVDHVERNGHHYFRGMSMFPRSSVDGVAEHHRDVLRRLPDGTPAVRIQGGRIDIGSVVDAPFGLGVAFEPGHFGLLRDWISG